MPAEPPSWLLAHRALVAALAVLPASPAWLGVPLHHTPAVAAVLEAPHLRADFGPRGLLSIRDGDGAGVLRLTQDEFAISIGGHAIESTALEAPVRRSDGRTVTYTWRADPYVIDVNYEVRPEWRFVSKQLAVFRTDTASFRVESVTVLRQTLSESPVEFFVPHGGGDSGAGRAYGAALRLQGRRGLLAVVQNPFLSIERAGPALEVRYAPGLEWKPALGPFLSDRGFLAPYRLTGRMLPVSPRERWRSEPPVFVPGMDEAEVEAFTSLVQAFLRPTPPRSLAVQGAWPVSDAELDIGTAQGKAEYARLLDRALEVGAHYVLYAPRNASLARAAEDADPWGHEHVLWLGLGQQIRRSQWDLRTGTLPPSVREALDQARARNLKLLAAVDPTVPLAQNADWIVTTDGGTDRQFSNLASRAWQDWLIDALVTFQKRTGIGGYAFDQVELDYAGANPYAQWYGWRRVLREVRRLAPDIVLEGRTSRDGMGPWDRLDLTYTLVGGIDGVGSSSRAFPDLHIDRMAANNARYESYRLRSYGFTPPEAVAALTTHHPGRLDTATADTRAGSRDAQPQRAPTHDWDHLGWRYALLSGIAAGGWSGVAGALPARDSSEFAAFRAEDVAHWRYWYVWAEEHAGLLARARPILGEPRVGGVDGVAAMADDSGYVFLFNPGGRAQTATVTLDSTLGLIRGARFVVWRIDDEDAYPIAQPSGGVWSRGDVVPVTMDGASATVLRLQPVPDPWPEAVLFNAAGTVGFERGVLWVNGARGEAGTSRRLVVRHAQAAAVKLVRVNGVSLPFARLQGDQIAVDVQFAGARFRHSQQVAAVDSEFAGGALRATFTVPSRVFDQLAERRREWPIHWTTDDYQAPWLVPDRLLLFVQVAEPDDRWNMRLLIDGRTVELHKAYADPRGMPSKFVGFYADVSLIAADTPHTMELEMPHLRRGQFQGVFFENVEPGYTSTLARAP